MFDFTSLLDHIKKPFKFTYWLEEYSLVTLKHDLQAGATVGIMLIPQSMAYAVIAGLPPVYGLYACILPLLIYPIFGTSKHIAIGTVAIDMVIISAGVSTLATPGSDEYILLVTLLALLVGIIQVIMFSAQLGYLVNYLSKPVISGFALAAAIIIISGQLGNLIGVEVSHTPYFYEIIFEIIEKIESIDLISLSIGAGSIVVLGVLSYFKPKFPGALLIMVVGIFLGWIFELPSKGLKVVGNISPSLPAPQLPVFSLEKLRELITIAITLSLVQFMTIVTLGKTYASRNDYTIDPNQEILGIGIGNILNGLFGAIPVSGSFSRSALNEQTRSRTPFSNGFAAIIVIIAILFLTPLLRFLPYASLAAVVIVAGLGLIDIETYQYMYKTKKRDMIIAIFTFLISIFIGIQEGILLGITASLLGILFRHTTPNIVELGHLPGTRSFKDVERFSKAKQLDRILMVRLDAAFSFANAQTFKEYIMDKAEARDEKIRAVIINGSPINDLDTTALESLRSIIETLWDKNIQMYFAGIKGPVRDVMKRAGLFNEIGKDEHFFRTPHRAVKHVLSKWDEDTEKERDERLDGYYDDIDEDTDRRYVEGDKDKEE